MEYTKGEWKIMGTHIYTDTPERGKGITRSIATVAEYNYDSESLANLHLIAQAPKMYEALKEARELIHPSNTVTLAKIDQALSKVEVK